jgi:hypothetical protein
MPFITPSAEGRDGPLEWAWKSVPHFREKVSGDALFVEVERDDGELMFLLIDVMDHGPKAAFVVDLFRTLYLGDEKVQDRQPGDLLFALSSLFAHHYNEGFDPSAGFSEWESEAVKGRHTCALALLLNRGSGRVTLAGAQQPDPYHLGAKDRTWKLIVVSSVLALGQATEVDAVQDPRLFAQIAIDLEPGDRLIAMTDGITQARPSQSQVIEGVCRRPIFAPGRLESTLADLAGIGGPTRQIDRLFEAVKTYVGGSAWPDDDTTASLWHRAGAAIAAEGPSSADRPGSRSIPPRDIRE